MSQRGYLVLSNYPVGFINKTVGKLIERINEAKNMYYPKTDNHLYTCWLFVPNVQQNVSIYARRRLLEKLQRNLKLF